MAPNRLSPSWYRVAALRPRLRSHARVHRHEYRGRRWYVLQDRISRRSHRLNPPAHYLVGLMDGRRTLQELWDAAAQRFGDEAPTQDEVIQLLGQLHAADLVQSEGAPDVDELLRRARRTRNRTLMAKLLAPLAIKLPLFDPDRLLERWLPWFRPLFGPAGALLWLAVVGWGAFSAAQHWNELTQDIGNRVLAPENLLVLGLVFPLLKAAHEFGHACAVKAWGGEVHEMGVMFLVLMPVPYVDASAASAFPERRQRVIVGAAGMAVELFIASAALLFWLDMQPGLPRAVLFNVMLIAGVSTVLFNANPLLRFDGYYILSDLIDIPNLRQRAQQYLGAVLQRGLFGVANEAVQATPREAAWFVFFSIASFLYRLTVTFAIAVFIGSHYFAVGVLLALWAVATGIVAPVLWLVGFIAFSPRLRRHRTRAVLTSTALAAVLFVLVFVVPVPSWTNAQGVLWDAEQSVVRSGADGFVQRVAAQPGSRVRRGDPLVEADDPLLPPRLKMVRAEKEAAEARYQAERMENLSASLVTLEKLKALDADLQRLEERARDLVVRAPGDGIFALAAPENLPGRFLKQGEQFAHVIPEGRVTCRVLVTQQQVHLVRSDTRAVSARLAERPRETVEARVLREVPLAMDRLPSLALSQAGGGEVALDPRTGAPKALQTHFELEIELLTERPAGAGGRVYLRFDHEPETAGRQVWRAAQQLYLKLFAV
ncbi:MAG TPA: PqqD family peptide modification chaperone [Burkholderiales bacterium]